MINKYFTLFLIVFCSFVGISTAKEANQHYEHVVIDENNWFLVEALGCMITIPNDYILDSKASPFLFSQVPEGQSLVGLGEIKIREYDSVHRPVADNLEFITIDNNEDIVYEEIRLKNRTVAFSLKRNQQVVYINHVDKEVEKRLSAAMYKYCIAQKSIEREGTVSEKIY